MSISIQNIQVKNLGPLGSLQESLGQVNLFYGLNETGKTYLVEFLLGSLFRGSRNWDLRPSSGTGSVQVRGLEQDLITFSPDRGRKLEDFWEEDGLGLPLNLARYLVVKGGELALSAGSPGGVDRDTLKSALTSSALLDRIWDAIPATIREARLENGQILGNNRGAIKTQVELQQEIHDLDKLLEQIEALYSRGSIRELTRTQEVLQEKIEKQVQAKRYLAYQTWKRSTELNQQQEALSKRGLQDLGDALRDLGRLDRDLDVLEEKYQEEKRRSADYPWLETALELWEKMGLEKKAVPPRLLGMIGLIGMGAGAAFLVLANFIPGPEWVWIGAGLAGSGLGLSLYYGIRLLNWSSQIEDSLERKAIQDEFEKRFNLPLAGLADLRTKKAGLQEVFISAQTTHALLTEKTHQRLLLAQAIENSLAALSDQSFPESKWGDALADLLQKSEALDRDILDNKVLLSKLDIPEEDHFEGPVEIEYDPMAIQSLEEEMEAVESDLAVHLADLENLKARACERTGDNINHPWKDVLYNLQTLRENRILEHKQLTAELIAKIGLSQVLTRMREEEDQKINQAIKAEPVSGLLFKMTGRYQKLDLADDQLVVADAYSSYPLSEISTGAREQVHLALRLGIASQASGGLPLFLILDDAFQHSDWSRREALVQSVLDLAQNGWQILYLTMDDHIRDLFLKVVKPALKKDFKLIQLS